MKLLLLSLCLSQVGCYAAYRVVYPDGGREFASGLGSKVEIVPGASIGKTTVKADTEQIRLGALIGAVVGGAVRGGLF